MAVTHRLASLAPVVFLVLALASPVAAVEPPPGVVLDGVVTVGFAEAGAAGTAIAEAAVTLRASVNDFDPPVQELTATTDADGVAVFSGVARPEAGGPVVLLSIDAARTTQRAQGTCTVEESWRGEATDVVAAATVDVSIVGFPASSISCPPPTDTPEGVAFDAGVIVTFVDADSGVPLADAAVNLTVSGEEGVIQVLDSTTAFDGTAAFEGVARPESGGPALTIAVEAGLGREDAVDGCTFSVGWHGEASAPAAPGVIEIDLAADKIEGSVTCEEPGAGAPVLTGTVLDEAGKPVDLDEATVRMRRSDGGRWSAPITVAADGSFSVTVQAWGTPRDPAELAVVVLGPVTEQRADDDCVMDFGQAGSSVRSVELANGGTPERIDVVTALRELGGVCGGVSSGAPASAAPTITLPPTDGFDGARGAASSPSLAGLLVTIGLIALAAAGSAIRRRRA